MPSGEQLSRGGDIEDTNDAKIRGLEAKESYIYEAIFGTNWFLVRVPELPRAVVPSPLSLLVKALDFARKNLRPPSSRPYIWPA